MDYDTVIATCNRPDVLRLSIPLILKQDVPPKRLIVADASDDHAPVAASVESASTACPPGTEIIVFQTPRGLTAQRNAAMQHSRSPVIMFPDDDSLWFPGAARAVMEVYQRDTEGRIGGVSLTELRSPPPGVLGEDPASEDRRSLSERLIYRFAPLRSRIEDAFTPNPLHVLGHELLAKRIPPDWLHELNATPVPYQLGFRSTYRASAIRERGFDETLSGYGLYEDHEAALGVLADSLLVMAGDAHVYHHRAPGARAAGRVTGVILLLNLCYITCRHSPVGSRARRAVEPYARTRIMQYRLRGRSDFGHDRLEGLRCARGHLGTLLSAPPDEAGDHYLAALKACLG